MVFLVHPQFSAVFSFLFGQERLFLDEVKQMSGFPKYYVFMGGMAPPSVRGDREQVMRGDR